MSDSVGSNYWVSPLISDASCPHQIPPPYSYLTPDFALYCSHYQTICFLIRAHTNFLNIPTVRWAFKWTKNLMDGVYFHVIFICTHNIYIPASWLLQFLFYFCLRVNCIFIYLSFDLSLICELAFLILKL
jgi:hypothetical protein